MTSFKRACSNLFALMVLSSVFRISDAQKDVSVCIYEKAVCEGNLVNMMTYTGMINNACYPYRNVTNFDQNGKFFMVKELNEKASEFKWKFQWNCKSSTCSNCAKDEIAGNVNDQKCTDNALGDQRSVRVVKGTVCPSLLSASSVTRPKVGAVMFVVMAIFFFNSFVN